MESCWGVKFSHFSYRFAEEFLGEKKVWGHLVTVNISYNGIAYMCLTMEPKNHKHFSSLSNYMSLTFRSAALNLLM